MPEPSDEPAPPAASPRGCSYRVAAGALVIVVVRHQKRSGYSTERTHFPAALCAINKGKSKKLDADRVSADEILPEYDFSRARPNKYAARYPKGGIVVTLDPDAVIGAENTGHAR